MKLKYQFELMEIEDMTIAVPVGEGADNFHGIMRLNSTAADILRLIQKGMSEETIITTLKKDYEDSEEDLAGYVRRFIEKLEAGGVMA